MEKVFCIGFSKTGTTSLEVALEKLGYKVCKGNGTNSYTQYLQCCYVNNDYNELMKIANYYNGFADAPWGGSMLYKEIIKVFPNAKIIVNYRNSKSWIDSLRNMFYMADGNNSQSSMYDLLENWHIFGRYGGALFFKNVLKISPSTTDDEIIRLYEDWYKDTYSNLDDNNIKYLNFNIEFDHDWIKLCKFLDKPIPNIAFPYANKGRINE